MVSPQGTGVFKILQLEWQKVGPGELHRDQTRKALMFYNVTFGLYCELTMSN